MNPRVGDILPVVFRDGWRAHKEGGEYRRNPFDYILQRISHDQWHDGWFARKDAVKHEKSLALDDYEETNWRGLL